jgi:Protein of unknown function (DUF1579)
MNTRTTSASTLALLAFATIAMAQAQTQTQSPSQAIQRTTTPTTNTASTTPSTTNFNDGDSESFVTTDSTNNQTTFFNRFTGTWKGNAVLHGFDGESQNSTISCTSTLTFGRYLTSTFNGEIMGQPFEAVQTWGFNTSTNAFETTWIDNNSTGITFNNGTANAEGTTFTIDGQVDDGEGNTIIQRSVTTFVDNNTFSLALTSVDSANVSTPVMTITFTRDTSATTASTSGNKIWNTTPATSTSNTQASTQPTTQPSTAPVATTAPVTPVVRTVYVYKGVDVEVTSKQLDAQRTASENEPRN